MIKINFLFLINFLNMFNQSRSKSGELDFEVGVSRIEVVSDSKAMRVN